VRGKIDLSEGEWKPSEGDYCPGLGDKLMRQSEGYKTIVDFIY